MLFTTLPTGYMQDKKLKYLEPGSMVQMVWLDRDHADIAAMDSALDVWGVMANWETDTYKLNREEYPESKARGLRVGTLLVELDGEKS